MGGKIEIMSVLSRFSGRFRQLVSSAGISFAFCICLLAIILGYRIQLTEGLLTSSVRPFDFNPDSHPVRFILSYLPFDLALVLACFLITWLFSRGSCFFKNVKISFLFKVLGLISLNLVITAILIIHAAHIRLLFDAQTGLDTAMILEVWTNIPFRELVRFINLKEALLLLVPIGTILVRLASSSIPQGWMVQSFYCADHPSLIGFCIVGQ